MRTLKPILFNGQFVPRSTVDLPGPLRSMKLGVLCLWGVLALTGCGATGGAGGGAAPANTQALHPAVKRRMVDEAVLVGTPTRKVSFETEIVIDHLETASSTSQHADASGRGIDVFPFTQPYAERLHLVQKSPQVAHVRILDAQGQVVAALGAQASTDVLLAPGDYQLELTSANMRDAVVYIEKEDAPQGSGLASQGAGGALRTPRRTVRGSSSSRTLAGTPQLATAVAAPPPTSLVIDEALAFGVSLSPAPTAIAGFVGSASSGPAGVTTLTSYADFTAAYGPTETPLALAVWAFFDNGGTTAQVVGVTVAGATPTAAELQPGLTALASSHPNTIVVPELPGMLTAEADAAAAQALQVAQQVDAMFVLDLPFGVTSAAAAHAWYTSHPSLQSDHAAAYWPPAHITTPGQVSVTVGVAGAIAGLYALTDDQEGVWNNPANQGLWSGSDAAAVGATPAVNLSNADQASMPRINAIRTFPFGPCVVWGASTLTYQAHYVAETRTTSFLQISIRDWLTGLVFSANDAQTWILAQASISNFLTDVWQQGGLVGDKATDAFSVTCGLGTSMTSQQILDGYMVVDESVHIVPRGFTNLTQTQTMEGI